MIAFAFLTAGTVFAAVDDYTPRSGDYVLCVKNDVFGDCDNDWDARAERHFWNEWKGGVPTAVTSVESNVEVEEQLTSLRLQLLNLLQELKAHLVS